MPAAFGFEAYLRGEGGTGILSELRAEGVPKRTLHRIVADALKAAANLWITKFLPMHFGPNAASRYGHRARSPRYNRVKSERPTISISGARTTAELGMGLAVPNPNFGLNPPRDWVYTGQLQSFVLGRAQSGQMLEAVATPLAATRLTAKVKVPYPHPMNPKYTAAAGNREITRVLASEWQEMSRLAIRVFRESLRSIRGKKFGKRTLASTRQESLPVMEVPWRVE